MSTTLPNSEKYITKRHWTLEDIRSVTFVNEEDELMIGLFH